MARKKLATGQPYKVEKGLPLPQKHADKRRFPFSTMQVGDSFFIPKTDQAPVRARVSIYSAANSYNKVNGKKIKCVTRSVNGGLRCWRIK